MTTRYIDLDGTLAFEEPWTSPLNIGKPVPDMVKKVKNWILMGDTCVIFTARITPSTVYGIPDDNSEIIMAIEKWCLKHLGWVLPITNIKGHFDCLYDDRAFRVIKNSGLTEYELGITLAERYLLEARENPDRALALFKQFAKQLKGE